MELSVYWFINEFRTTQEKYITTNKSISTLFIGYQWYPDFSKIESGKLDLFIEQYNMGEVKLLILYESNQKKLNLNLNLSPDIFG
jgi:hypothetical protein